MDHFTYIVNELGYKGICNLNFMAEPRYNLLWAIKPMNY